MKCWRRLERILGALGESLGAWVAWWGMVGGEMEGSWNDYR